jgi:hypothetical protein
MDFSPSERLPGLTKKWRSALLDLPLSETRKSVRDYYALLGEQAGAWTPARAIQQSHIGIFDAHIKWDEALPKASSEVSSTWESVEILEENLKYPTLQNPEWILIPAMLCDLTGRRIGRGKGYYDRYLSQFPKTKAVAVLHSDYVFQELPSEWFHSKDRRVQGVLTERGATWFDDCLETSSFYAPHRKGD